MPVPHWVAEAVFYQIFPDRFANGDPTNDPPDVQPWGAPPTLTGFQGGDLRGILQRLDYLIDLGVTAIYLNPIFAAGSNHRYNISDYLAIDDRLGTLADFTALVEAAHARGLRIILDGVFNHSGRGFFAFRDLLDHGPSSAYRDWYHVRRFPIDAFGEGPAENYLGWWNFRSLPKLNVRHAPVRRYLLDVARTWIERGADGWRLDVPNEIDDESFWAELRRVVKRANPEAYLVGEIWTVDPRWVGRRAFDGLTNYPLRAALLDLVVEGRLTPSGFRAQVETLAAAYPEPHLLANLNLLGSHDTARVARLAGDGRRVRLLFALLCGLPGAPLVYYGDEIGLEGGKDPDSRRAFPWDRSRWDVERREWVRTWIRLRRERPELQRGRLEFLVADDEAGLVVFARRLGESTVVLAANVGRAPRQVHLAASATGWRGVEVRDELTGRALDGRGDVVVPLGPLDCALLIADGPDKPVLRSKTGLS